MYQEVQIVYTLLYFFANHVLSERSASQADIKASADGSNNLAVDQHIDETITGLLGRIMDGTCRPLKVGCYIDVWRANFFTTR